MLPRPITGIMSALLYIGGIGFDQELIGLTQGQLYIQCNYVNVRVHACTQPKGMHNCMRDS